MIKSILSYLKNSNNSETLFLNIFLTLTIIVLFLKFFVLYPIFPSSDEIVQVERFTEWHNFLRREGLSNHTINAFLAVIIKSLFGYDILYYRFISFFCFCLVIYIFKKKYPSTLALSLFLFLIFSSPILTNYIYIFRGYYVWALLVVLNFYFIKKLISNNFDNKNYNIILIINSIMACHALFTLYIVVPTIAAISLIVIKNKDITKIYNFFIFFLIPCSFFYFVVCVLEGFVNKFHGNLSFDYLLNNFFHIVQVGLPEGINKIFFSQHMLDFEIKENIFVGLYKSLTSRNDYTDYGYTVLVIYIFSFCLLLFRIITRKLNIIDFIAILIIIFFYIIDFVPEKRVHIGVIFFYIFYIFENIYNSILIVNKKIKLKYFFYTLVLMFLLININPPDEKYSIHTKNEIIKVRKLKEIHTCNQLNKLLNDHEIWVMKNLYSNECSSKYDFVNNKNILY
jgi:hypothetical protein